MKIAMSVGHGQKIRGASCGEEWGLDEVDSACDVVPAVAKYLRQLGHEVEEFFDTVSTTQNENLNRIVDWTNEQFDGDADLAVSVHFNAYMVKPADMGGMGTEVLYLTQEDLAQRVVNAISNASGLINRGPKKRTDLFFLNQTYAPAILLEICFVDCEIDANLYRKHFDDICKAIARVGNQGRPEFFEWEGKVSWFGGVNDQGVSPSEPLAFIYSVEDQPTLFLDEQPPGTTGLARRLDENEDYFACRFDYSQTPREMLLAKKALVHAPKTGREFYALAADWGPHISTDRVADISPGLMERLGIETDDIVKIIFPAP